MFIALGLTTFLWLWPWFRLTRRVSLHSPDLHALAPVPYRQILRRRECWGAALGHFSLNYTFYFVITWLPTFLVKAGGFTVSEMATIGAAIYGIYAVATAIAGAASDRWIRSGASVTRVRKTFVLTSALGSAITIAGSAYVAPRAAVWLLGASGVFFGLATPMVFAVGATLAGPRAAGRWAGAQNLAGQLAGIVAPLVTGVIVDRTGAFSWAFVVSAAAGLLAIVARGIVVPQVATVQWPEAPTPSRVAAIASTSVP